MSDNKDEAIRSDILNEAQKLFGHFGLAKTTMEDIAKAAGKGKSTLYYYYKSKDEIFDAVVIREMEEVFRIVKQEVDKVETAEEKLKVFFLTKFNIVQGRANLWTILRGDIEANLHHIMDLHRRYELKELSLVRNILKFGLGNGEFAHYAAEDVDAVAFGLVCAFRGLEVGLLVENKFADFEARLGVIHGILMQGLRA
ncbi:TetR/AcrR family transcriptional regulator [Pontibacter sp. 13R65]|uniref:TetR/AcrR family transcriptional regulator n=1 Tax=Pontibacter sp. 13R65 TaxID=3127458 RepID=UPI00301C1E77